MKKIAIVIPCHNEESNLARLHEELVRVTGLPEMAGYDFEFILVDDGSRDATLSGMRRLHEEDPRVTAVALSRNFGKESAMLAGLDIASEGGADAVVIMDADLQHPPSVIPLMVAKWEGGADDVFALRESRETDSHFRRFVTRAFYRVLKHLNPMAGFDGAGDFRLLDRWAVDSLRSLRESHRYTKGLYDWIGGRKEKVPYVHAQRNDGKSSFGLLQQMRLALDGVTGFSTRPLRMATYLGLAAFVLSFVYLIAIVVKYLMYGDPVQGFATIVCVILLLGGVQLCCLGIIGEYLGRTFMEGKKRPSYVIRSVERG